jgi:lysyl endopeptidase
MPRPPRLRAAALAVMILPLLAALTLLATPAQAAPARPYGLTREVLSLQRIDERVLGFVDVDFLRFEDEVSTREKPGRVPFRVAEPIALDASPASSGTRETLADGGTLWRLRVTSPGAVFLSFLLRDVSLPPGAHLSFYSVDHAFETELYTGRIHNAERRFGSPAIPGDSAVVELYTPARAAWEPSLVVESVSHGYRDFNRFRAIPLRNGLRSLSDDVWFKAGACEVDVNCQQGAQWQADKRAVARTYDGRYLCTGALINNARQDCRPLFLTAAHCVSRSRTAAAMTFYWNYENSTCGGSGARLNQTTSGASLRVTGTASDFTLLELNSRPNSAYNVYFAGFDRSAEPPAGAVTIHHPVGEAKKISFENDLVQDGGDFSDGWGDTHWRIAGWDVGTTEGGSSGCPLFNASHRIVGQLHGGTADCGGGWDEFGKLSSSWDSGLAAWLDPGATGLTSLGGKESSTCAGGSCRTAGTACTANKQCCSKSCRKKSKTCA